MVKLVDLLTDPQPSFSIELWPPRNEAARTKLTEALPILGDLHPTFTSITYGAAGSTRGNTHELVMQLAKDGQMLPMAHLTCAAHAVSELEEILRLYWESGVKNILALRGDPPLDSLQPLSPGELVYAHELVRLAKSIAGFTVAVAAHPEGHPESKSLTEDRIHLAEKLEVADFAITQFYFRSSSYFELVDGLRRRGISKPIIPGIMAPTSWKTLLRMSELSKTQIPDQLRRRFEALQSDPVGTRKLGVEVAVLLCEEALDGGAPGVHIYTMNSAESTVEIYEAISHRLGR